MSDIEEIAIVDACVRGGAGGSPTAVVVDDATLDDADRRLVPARAATSHAAFVARVARPDGSVPVRFFTAEGELSGCGHGTIAAQALRLAASGRDRLRARQWTGGRGFDAVATRRPDGAEVWFDQGVIDVRRATRDERAAVLPALGLTIADLHPDDEISVASPGTPRLLVPVASREILWSVGPALDALARECRRLGHLGCFVYVPPDSGRPAAARMFAPAIGVDEDIANANSTGCLAAHLLTRNGVRSVAVEQGDLRRRPATIFASAQPGPDGVRVWVGGLAVIRGNMSIVE